MNELVLSYEPEDEHHGQIHARAKISDFSGVATAWFNRDDIEAFGQSLTQYPIDAAAPIKLVGGVIGNGRAGSPEHVHVGISIQPFDLRGTLSVQIELAKEAYVSPYGYITQRAHLIMLTNYSELSKFSININAMLVGRVQAILSANTST